MRQRVAFLRTLLSGKPVLCLDEPFGALDAITRAGDAGLARRARSRAEPRTVVLVTHDVEEAILLADRVPICRRGPGAWSRSSRSPLPRPRSRTDAPVVALRERALDRARPRRDGAPRCMPGRRRCAAAGPGSPLLVLLGAWELYVDSGSGNSFVLPAPHSIATAMWNNAGLLAANLAVDRRGGRARASRSRSLFGFALGGAIHLSPLAAPRGVSAGRRLPGRADRR